MSDEYFPPILGGLQGLQSQAGMFGPQAKRSKLKRRFVEEKVGVVDFAKKVKKIVDSGKTKKYYQFALPASFGVAAIGTAVVGASISAGIVKGDDGIDERYGRRIKVVAINIRGDLKLEEDAVARVGILKWRKGNSEVGSGWDVDSVQDVFKVEQDQELKGVLFDKTYTSTRVGYAAAHNIIHVDKWWRPKGGMVIDYGGDGSGAEIDYDIRFCMVASAATSAGFMNGQVTVKFVDIA